MMLEEIVEFSKLAGKLKTVKRKGWVTKFGMKNPESDADHTYMVALIAMVIGDSRKLDTEKLMRMALIHDLEESVMGDWDVDMKNKLGWDKYERTKKGSIRKILGVLPKKLEKKYLMLWEELNGKRSKYAKLIEEIDKLELCFQILEYEKTGYDRKKLAEFWKFSDERIKDTELRKILDILRKE